MPPIRMPRGRRVLLAALAAAVACAAATTAVGVAGSWWATVTGVGLAGASGVVTGSLLLVRAWRERSRSGRGALGALRALGGFRTVGALMALTYGAGQVLLAIGQARAGGPLPFPAPGDLVSLSCFPFAIGFVITLPRPAGAAGALPRLLPDALVLATAGSLLLWRLAFLDERASTPATLASAAVVLVELFVLALLVQVAVVGLDPGVVLIALGAAVLAAADLSSAALVLHGVQADAWAQAACVAAAWPLVSGGIALARTRPAPGDPTRAEARASTTTVAVLAVCGTGVAATALGGLLDAVSVALLGLLLAACTARELVLQHQRVRQVAALSDAADLDPLTGLANRRAMAVAVEDLGREGGPVGVLVLDLDGFKEVNDRLGHSTGDALIVAVARGLASVTRGGTGPGAGFAVRLGGDEFALLVRSEEAEVAALADRLAGIVHDSAAAVPGVARVRVSASIGLVMTSGPELAAAPDPLAVVSAASAAMQEAKRTGRDRVVRYSGAVADAAARRSALADRLREALEEGRVVAHLQPVVDLTTGALRGFEALARWDDEVLGRVSPEEFVPAAERTGLVVPLGATVLRQALAALAQAPAAAGLRLSVNASPLELRAGDYADRVAAALVEAGVPASSLVVEVTEGVLVGGDDPAVATLRALREMGVGVAVDDFGTGWSSLAYLTRFPLSELKLDRSLVGAVHDGRTGPVLAAVVAMARSLGVDVVAEGVEHEDQRRTLADLGVEYGQGWLWSAALAPGESAALLARGDAHEPWVTVPARRP